MSALRCREIGNDADGRLPVLLHLHRLWRDAAAEAGRLLRVLLLRLRAVPADPGRACGRQRRGVLLCGPSTVTRKQDHAATWRHDIEALVFEPEDHQGSCMVHRRAFRTLLRFTPAPPDCETYFRTHEQAFRAAASAKIVRHHVTRGRNFHLTSRDVARQIKN